MFEPKIKITRELLDSLRKASEVMKCSVEELCHQILERECETILEQGAGGEVSSRDIDEISKSLKGLGYLE